MVRQVDELEHSIDKSLLMMGAHTGLGLDTLNCLAVKDWFEANEIARSFRESDTSL